MHKQMFSLFEEMGIFISSCQHQMVLYTCDMIQSGELFVSAIQIDMNLTILRAKYPLAIVNQLLQDVGSKIGCTYDIGCEFSKTITNSCLGLVAHQKDLRMVVGAFHGHAHNRGCQLSWHLLHIDGTSLTEGKGCEHIFAASNDVTQITWHSNRFHCRQAIEDHFWFWDQDKYALLSLESSQQI